MRLIDADVLKTKKIYSEERHEKVVPVAEIDWMPTVDAVPRDELINLAKKVSDMREAQKRYFKGRSLNDLTVSKQLEAEVDATVKAILDSDLTLF